MRCFPEWAEEDLNSDGVVDEKDVKIFGDVESECPEGQPAGLEELLYGLEHADCHEIVIYRELYDDDALREKLAMEDGISD